MYSQVSFVKKLLKLGATGYVTKNSPQGELIDAIISVSDGKRYICSEIINNLTEQIFELESFDTKTLSSREVDVVKFIKQGLSSKEIAKEMNISVKTVEVYRHYILKKLNIRNTAALVNYINNSQLII
jgi:DNA-binding NarL/FixJ family response regulator